jgi:hypothetical protein
MTRVGVVGIVGVVVHGLSCGGRHPTAGASYVSTGIGPDGESL